MAKIKHVEGNKLQLAIPLTIQTVTVDDGETSATVTDFVPNPSYPVEIVLKRGSKEQRYDAWMDGNIAVMEDLGTLERGTYSVIVLCRNDAGEPLRFKQRDVVEVVDLTAEAGIEAGIEYNAETHYLDAAVFMAVSGVGIANVLVTESQESGGQNLVTIVLTDGRETSFSVRNGVDGNAVLRHEPIEPEEFERKRENNELSENTIYLVYEEE